ncbi:Stk1 family PASTA domain-containing Ser/Thr kinase [Streptomyces calidiresistens]|uniref:non-specific serine/threonine protein kinase n=1 Tax=Streptomyces calidiresistens TaxID=1485586 RepID=A0A7W3T6N2_9ACTN|nr:Stk1 family PASTA domain-containing Ser/Thr kinase [Streptomyces calidiresistens]MBB0231778.1 Stk1 family PASTA domain-containing Ser/Thr kinase [Streptomyces calidiresistens]
MDTTVRDPLIGHLLDDRYHVEARVAVGGMATVYRALDTRLDRRLALKVMHPSLAVDSGFVERFIREAKAAARLDHPNVVGVTDQGRDRGWVYLAMEYVPGCTLRDVLRDGGPLTPRAVLDILEPVLAGLGAAHRAGLVHRDVKPENVLIGDDGRVKVADFGLVRGVDAGTSTGAGGTGGSGSLLGTVSYLAPEQIEHGTVEPRGDVYACGIMLYEMLTGTKPHTGDSPAQVLLSHVRDDVPAPSLRVPGLPSALDRLVAVACERNPSRRPADAAVLLSLTRSIRAGMTDAELDAVPDTRAPSPPEAWKVGSEDPTSVVPVRSVLGSEAPDRVERTAVIEVPPVPEEPAPGYGQPGDPGDPQPLRRRPRRARLALLGLLVAVLGLGAGFWYVNAGQFLRTPGVYDLPRAEAERVLDEAGLRAEFREEFSPVVEAGHVIATQPERGDRIRRNGTVTVTLSRGPEVVEVPDVAGMPEDTARDALREVGLTPGDSTAEFHPTVPRGAVISTEPAAGAERRPDSAVALTVSRGRELSVPDVVGMPEGTAIQRLRETGFEVEVTGERVHAEQEAGTVAAQSPGTGESAGEGDTVTLEISKGPEMIVVPDVRGMEEDAAIRVLEDAGFEVEVQRVFFFGTVFNQSVHSGGSAPKGSTITIYVR